MFEELKGKRLLIIGGIKSNVEVVNIAHELGVEVLVTDYLEDSPAKKVADKSFMTSATDVDAVVQLCKDQEVDGILTGHVDMLLPYYAKICEKAGLPCYGTYNNFITMIDKVKFKDLCRDNVVPTIPEYSIDSGFDSISYPVLIKPVDSSGSRGISVCENEEQLKRGIDKALSFSAQKEYLVEKYMTGDEIVLYYYFQDGNPVFMGMCDRYVNKEQEGVAQISTAYVFPSKYTKNHLKYTDKKIKNMFKSCRMTNGTIFLQAFADEDGNPCLYEPGYRLNGAREQYIFSETSGIHSTKMLINYAITGKMADFDISEKADPFLGGLYGCMLSSVIKKGKICRIDGIEKVRALKSVKHLIFINEVGDIITDKSIGTLSQIGYRAYVIEESVEKLKESLDYIIDNLIYYDENNESMMLSPFNTELLLEKYK